MAKFVTLIVFIVLVEGVGALIGTAFSVGEWYNALNKPFFMPEPAVFGIVWPVLYLLVAIAGWRIFTSEGELPGWGLWVGQLVLNWSWSPIFFGAHQLFWSIWILVGVLSFSLAFMSVTWDKDRVSAICFVPYVAWLAFALIINISVWALN
ncbi:MAG: TspO/MBR family protein [Rhizobiaceae bacterium]